MKILKGQPVPEGYRVVSKDKEGNLFVLHEDVLHDESKPVDRLKRKR